MTAVYLLGFIVILYALYVARKFIKLPLASSSVSNEMKAERWKKRGLNAWRAAVIVYALWLLWNFWKVIIYPATPITIEQITNTIFHPPFIQLILALTFAWLSIALLNAPLMHLKGINTPFLRFEMDKIEKVVQMGNADIEASRVIDEIRWAIAKVANMTNPYEDVTRKAGESDLELFARTMGGIVYETFYTANQIEYSSGVVMVDKNGHLQDVILYLLPSETQYVIRNAHHENDQYFSGANIAVPIRFKNEEAIFYCYNKSITMAKTDCMMIELIWGILLKRA